MGAGFLVCETPVSCIDHLHAQEHPDAILQRLEERYAWVGKTPSLGMTVAGYLVYTGLVQPLTRSADDLGAHVYHETDAQKGGRRKRRLLHLAPGIRSR